MELDRKVTIVTRLGDPADDGWVNGTPSQRIAMVWDITVALWSIATKGQVHAGTRLRRDVAVLRPLRS